MNPLEALEKEEYGALYVRANGHNRGNHNSVHTDPDCHHLAGAGTREITHPAELPLRVDLCKTCDPDHTVEKSNDSRTEGSA